MSPLPKTRKLDAQFFHTFKLDSTATNPMSSPIQSLPHVAESIADQLQADGYTILTDPKTLKDPSTPAKVVLLLSPDYSIVEGAQGKHIFVAPVTHEVFLSDLTDCTVACSAQQVRIRRCHRVRLFNFTKGSIFSEVSSGIVVAPYSFHEDGDERKAGELDRRRFTAYQCSDNPFNPGVTFSVAGEGENFFD